MNNLSALQKNRDEQISKYEKTVKETEDNIQSLMGNIDEKTENVVALESTIKNQDSTQDKLKQVVELEKQLETARKKQLQILNSTKTTTTARHVNRT